MIFNTDVTPNNNLNAVKESKYDLGIAGALMHVYENECNYNAIVKSVGISELKYYQETGKDLFVNEAGAFKGFANKAKEFFKAIIEKIKSIFKKFAAVMNQYVMKDKDFVKKYKKQALNNIVDAKNFELKGYTFEGLDAFVDSLKSAKDTFDDMAKATYDNVATDIDTSEDAKEKAADGNRGIIIGGPNASEALDHAEFIEALNNKCYGNDKEKDDIAITYAYMNTAFASIESAKSDIEAANKACKAITDQIQKVVDNFDKMVSNFDKDNTDADEDTSKKRASLSSAANYTMAIYKQWANDYTTAFGAATGALKDRNRQYKAFAVKCLSYKKPKNEAATYSESTVDDIFANVVIR